MKGCAISQENGDGGRKRKGIILDENRKRLKTGGGKHIKSIASLSPEKMSADELCLVLQEKRIDIEDIRAMLVYRFKKAIREELENSKIINVKKEFTVKEETTEGIEEDYQNKLQRGEYMELETKGIKKVKNEEDYQIEQGREYVLSLIHI